MCACMGVAVSQGSPSLREHDIILIIKPWCMHVQQKFVSVFVTIYYYLQARTDFIARQKLGRLGSAEEIASMVVYLASNEVHTYHIHTYIRIISCGGASQ